MALLIGIVLVVGLAVEYWYVTVPLVAALGIGGLIAVRRSARREEARVAELERQRAIDLERQRAEAQRQRVQLALRSRERARQRAEAHRAWLAAPPPPLDLPSRFSDGWFAAHLPQIHPGQVPELLAELRDRGWSDARIARRVQPYLDQNPDLRR